MASQLETKSQKRKTFVRTLRTYSLSGPAGAGADLGQVVGRVVSPTVLGLRREEIGHYMINTSSVSDSQTSKMCPVVFTVMEYQGHSKGKKKKQTFGDCENKVVDLRGKKW